VIAGLLDAAEQQNVSKVEITDAVFLENFIGNAKYLPCISLVHAATERRAPVMLRVVLPGVEQQFAESTERALPGSRLFGALADRDWVPFEPPAQRWAGNRPARSLQLPYWRSIATPTQTRPDPSGNLVPQSQ
jgi:hypothetical protein